MTAYWSEATGQYLEIDESESEVEFCNTPDNNQLYKVFLHCSNRKYHSYAPRLGQIFGMMLRHKSKNYKEINNRRKQRK